MSGSVGQTSVPPHAPVRCFRVQGSTLKKLRNKPNWSRKGQDEQDGQDVGFENYQTNPLWRTGTPVSGFEPRPSFGFRAFGLRIWSFAQTNPFPIGVLGVHSWFNPDFYQTNPSLTARSKFSSPRNYETKPFNRLYPCFICVSSVATENYQTNPTSMDRRFQIPDLRWRSPVAPRLSAAAHIYTSARKQGPNQGNPTESGL